MPSKFDTGATQHILLFSKWVWRCLELFDIGATQHMILIRDFFGSFMNVNWVLFLAHDTMHTPQGKGQT